MTPPRAVASARDMDGSAGPATNIGPDRRLRLVFVVHGRFHCFDLARELIRDGHDVTVLTNYPSLVGARFGLPPQSMRTCITHGILARSVEQIFGSRFREKRDSVLHPMFGAWAAGEIAKGRYHAVHCFSGVAEETLRMTFAGATLRTMVRGSAHIAKQHALLCEEEARVGHPIDKPTRWMIQRETREYALADLIFVLSSFALKSFLEMGVAENRLRLLPLGTELRAFLTRDDQLSERLARIRSRAPLRVLYVGAFSAQKGALDFATVAERLAGKFEFKVVGPVTADGWKIAHRISQFVEFAGKVPHYRLPEEYRWGDVFLFPTIQDGFAAVLSQAQASGLPIIGTTNCAAPDIVQHGVSGWIVPIRCPSAIIEHLDWCDRQRGQLAEIVENIRGSHVKRDWSDVARDFATCIQHGR